MNQDQAESFISKLIVGASAATVAKVGIDVGSWTSDVTDAVALAFAIGTMIWSHYYNKPTPTTPPPSKP